MVTVAQRRAAVDYLIDRRYSQRHACRLVGLPRSVAWYRRKGRDDAELRGRLKVSGRALSPLRLSDAARRCSNRKGALSTASAPTGSTARKACRCAPSAARRSRGPECRCRVPTKANERWSADFVSDQLANGRRFRIFNLIDDFSRQCVGQIVDTSISGARLARYLDELSTTRPLPRTLVLDNGPEFTSKAMFFWAKRTGVRLHFIQPGKPTQNAFAESFNGKFREYCLDLHWVRQPD